MAQWKQIRLGTARLWVQSLALLSGLRIQCCVSCGGGHTLGSDLALLWLWLWHRPAAVAPIRPLAWEPPYATGLALKSRKKKKKRKKKVELSLECGRLAHRNPSTLETPACVSPWQPPGCPQRHHHQSLEETPGPGVWVSILFSQWPGQRKWSVN